jgi:predicted PurR-regulated permease PerM
MTRSNLFTAFFFSALLFLLYQLYLILSPFASPLILAAVVSLTLAPVRARLRTALHGSRTQAAVVMSLGTAAIDERMQRAVQEGGDTPFAASQSWLGATRAWLIEHFPAIGSLDFAKISSEASQKVAGWVAGESRLLMQDVAGGLLGGTMMLVALFFFFRDGDRIATTIGGLIPMEAANKERVGKQLSDTVAAVVQSTVLIAILQGIVGGFGYFVIGRFSVTILLAFLTAVASLVPVVGAALVWVPSAIYLMATGELIRGMLLVAWGVVAVGSVDNFVRPLVIGGRVEIPTFLLLFALLGGLQVYGFLGIFVAPVMVAILLAFVEIYREPSLKAEPAAEEE